MQHTDMSNLIGIPSADYYETRLANMWNWTNGTVYVEKVPEGSMPISEYSYIVVNPWEVNMQVAKIDGWDSDNDTFNVIDVAIPSGAWTYYNAKNHPVGSVVRFSNNYAFWKDIQEAINGKLDITSLAPVAVSNDYNDLCNKPTIPTDNCELCNGCWYITWISCTDVTDALGYTPYDNTNPDGYTTCTWTLTSSDLACYTQFCDLPDVSWFVEESCIACINGCCLTEWWDITIQGAWWDMEACVYDPNNCATDVFDYCNMYNTPTIPTDNCQLANSCGFTTCTWTLTACDIANLAQCCDIPSVSGLAQCCDIPTNNCELINWCWYIKWITCGDVTGALWYTPANSANLWTASTKNTWTCCGDVPILWAGGKLDNSIIPSVAISDTFTVTNKADLTWLTSAEKWDVWIVTAENKTYILSADPYSTAANWKELLTPTDAVISVNWQTWAVCINIPTDNCQLSNGCGYTTCTWTVVAGDLTPYAKCCELWTVAFSNKYCDLSGQPTIPTDNCQLWNSCWYTTCTWTVIASDLTPYAKTCDLAAVASSWKYCDLSGRVTDNCQIWNSCWYTTCTWTLSSCADVISALWYTPYNSTNPSWYTTCIWTVTSSDLACYTQCCDMVCDLTWADDTHYPTAKAVADAIQWAGGGDMMVSTYDPCNCNADAFDYSNFHWTPDLSCYVTWPASSKDWNIAIFDWATWKLVKDSARHIEVFVITEDMITKTTTATKWVAPYNTSYYYTNFEIDATKWVKRVEWWVYYFVWNTLTVASSYRNVRVRIWSDGDWIPMMDNAWTIQSGYSYVKKAYNKAYIYSTKYQAWWALHWEYDVNSTYSAMTTAEIDAWTCTTGRTITAVNLKYAIDCCVANRAQCCDIPTDNCQLWNSCGYTTCTWTLSSCGDITTALWYTPYSAANPCGYTTCTGTVSSCSDIISKLWYTPYSSANPNWYTSCTWTVVASDLNAYAKTCILCTVATSGKYCDLTWKPTIPTNNNQLTNWCGYTTCTWTLTPANIACINGCCLTNGGNVCIESGWGGTVMCETSYDPWDYKQDFLYFTY